MSHSATSFTTPAFRFRSSVRKNINQWRLNLDVAGLTFVNTFGPLLSGVHSLWMHIFLTVYPFMATAVVLTVDPKRLPEATSTRIKQRAAWRATMFLLPLSAAVVGGTAWVLHVPFTLSHVQFGLLFASVFQAFFGELYWRNILQPKLRQIGLSRDLSILVQSALFSLQSWFTFHSVGLSVLAMLLGIVNGWISHRYRTMLPGFVMYTLWLMSFTL